VPTPSGVAFHEGKKVRIPVRLTSHNVSGNREFVANLQKFAERNGNKAVGIRVAEIAANLMEHAEGG
jgi:hypothetical protein